MRSKYGVIPEGAVHFVGDGCANCERIGCEVSTSIYPKPCEHSRIVRGDDYDYTLLGTVAKWANMYDRRTGGNFANWVGEVFYDDQRENLPCLFKHRGVEGRSIENCADCDYSKTCEDAIREESS